MITYLKLTKKNAKDAWKEKIINQDVILLDLKIIIYVTNVNNVKKWLKLSLSSLPNSLFEINKKECKEYMERKNIKSECEFIWLKNDKLSYRCKECEKQCLKPVNGLIRNFSTVYQFCNDDLNRFVQLLRKGVYPYEYLDSWERFDKTSLPDK